VSRDPLAQLTTRSAATPQSRAADPRQVPNNAGGYTFTITPWDRLDRFLTLGVSGGTFYVGERELAQSQLEPLLDLIALDGRAVARRVAEISHSGRAPKQNPGLFVLAAVAGMSDVDGRRAAIQELPNVARTGSTLKTFVKYAEQFRGWGPLLRHGVADWYLNRDLASLAYQAVKYGTRDGWSDRDLLRLSHPKAARDDVARRALFDWMCGRPNVATPVELDEGFLLATDDELKIVEGYERLKKETNPVVAASLVTDYRLPWEAIPDRFVNEPIVLNALVDVGLPQTALVRQLPRLTRATGVLTGERLRRVASQLHDAERLRYGRVHPINVLIALNTYAAGRSFRGTSTWQSVRQVVDALDAAFYNAFPVVQPTGKRLMLALDVSGSMDNHRIADTNLSPREVAGALALVTMATEPDCHVVGFTGKNPGKRYYNYAEFQRDSACGPLTISPRQRLDDVVRTMRELPFAGTDCAQPMLYALENGLAVDTFVVYTDNETWQGEIHAHEALKRYRERTGIKAKLVVVGMVATEFTIADPNDAGMLDVAGFDSAVPGLISDFARGA
jgi:60 kDa SS-A/Ro ribonucleoprotein